MLFPLSPQSKNEGCQYPFLFEKGNLYHRAIPMPVTGSGVTPLFQTAFRNRPSLIAGQDGQISANPINYVPPVLPLLQSTICTMDLVGKDLEANGRGSRRTKSNEGEEIIAEAV
jgi:hypothetical protein